MPSLEINKNTRKLDGLDHLASMCGVFCETQKKKSGIKEEINKYATLITSTGLKFDSFWTMHAHEMPDLASVVRVFNVICGTSVPSEASFSIANFIERKERSSLSNNNLRYTCFMVLRNNIDLNKLIESLID